MTLPVCLLQIYNFEKTKETKIDELPFFLYESTFFLTKYNRTIRKILAIL
jgi:hypothetical protein